MKYVRLTDYLLSRYSVVFFSPLHCTYLLSPQLSFQFSDIHMPLVIGKNVQVTLAYLSTLTLSHNLISPTLTLPSICTAPPPFLSISAILSGKELFNYNSSLFVDDEGAIDASEENALAMQTKIGQNCLSVIIPTFLSIHSFSCTPLFENLFFFSPFRLLLFLSSIFFFFAISFFLLFRSRGRGETRGHRCGESPGRTE